MLRLVPDDTKFDFMRFRRISFPASAVLSIAAICLYFLVGLNFGIDFVGGTLLEVRTKSAAPADLANMRTSLGALGLGDIQLQEFGSSDRSDGRVVSRGLVAEPPVREAAQRPCPADEGVLFEEVQLLEAKACQASGVGNFPPLQAQERVPGPEESIRRPARA